MADESLDSNPAPGAEGDRMPLSINVGLSRKSSENYQSQGVSINIVAELDQSLLARPDELQEQIDNLYAQAAQALDRQADASVPVSQPQPARPAAASATAAG